MISGRYIFGNRDELHSVFPTFVPIKAVNKFIMNRVMNSIGDQAKAQGMGRHKKETVMKMAEDDLETLDLALKGKDFLMGSDITEIDCVAFGFLNLLFYFGPEDHGIPKIARKFEDLVKYSDRIKERLWPDFDDLCKAVAEEKAAKKEKKDKSGASAAAADAEEGEGAAAAADGDKNGAAEGEEGAGAAAKDDDKAKDEKKDEEKK